MKVECAAKAARWGVGATALAAALAAMLNSSASAQTAPAAPPPATPAPPPPHHATAPTRRPRPRNAQTPDQDTLEDQADEATSLSSVTVTARPNPRLQYGAVVGDILPELQMSPADIQSYGVSTVTELLNEIAPQTRSDHGRSQQQPVILLNGRRISSLAEVQNIPTEAILRIDILPEEVSLKYGYTADQRVVNIVLKRRFRAVTAEATGGTTTAGGDETTQAEVDQFQVRRDQRANFDLKYQYAAGLTDAQRGLVEPAGGAPFSLAGNVVSPTGGEIDPALSDLVGHPVTVAGVPAGVAADQHLARSDFASGAGIANVTDTAADHSLLPATQNLTGNAVLARPIFWGIDATVNATLTGTTSDALQGLPGVALATPAGDPFSPFSQAVNVDRYVAGEPPLRQDIDGWTGHLGLTLNRDFSSWRVSLTTAYNHSDTITETDVGLDASALQAQLNALSATANPFGPLPSNLLGLSPRNSARSITDGGNIQVLVNGPLVRLPAGALYLSAKLGDVEAYANSSSRNGDLAERQGLGRNIGQGQLNLDLPIASREHHVLGFLGELSVDANTAVDQYSDFGTLVTLGYGVNWTPLPGYNLIVSETHDHQAPTLQQLDGPMVATPNVRVFDYATGQTATVTEIGGGSPELKADDRHVWKVGLTIKPFAAHDLTFTANYIQSHIANGVSSFPAATAAIEAAFPTRFERDEDGALVLEDNRAVNFASEDRQELRWGINFSMPVGKQPPPPAFHRPYNLRRRNPNGGQGRGGFGGPGDGGPGGPPGGPDAGPGGGPGAPGGAGGDEAMSGGPGAGPGEPPGEPGGGRPFGGGFGGGHGRGRAGFGGGAPGGRLQFAVYQTVYFRDQYQVTPGGPVLDLLNGAPAGASGGQYQQEIEAQFGFIDNGYGARLSADWRSGTTVQGGAAGGAGALDFSDVSTVNFRLWDDFSPQHKLLARYPILRGVRITLNVINLFDQSIHVRDSAGPTPFAYQSALLDPTGRVVSLSLRKLFY
jgi:hypothetical protein